MKPYHFFFALCSLIFVCILFGLSVLFFCCFWAMPIRESLIEILQFNPEVFLALGGVLFLLGIFFLAGFYFFQYRRSMRIKVKMFPCTVDLLLIEKFVKKFFLKKFPMKEFRVEVMGLPKQRIEVIAYLSDMEEFYQKEILQIAKKDLAEFLRTTFQYQQEFLFTVYPI